jgi:hypothetical protein
MGATSRLVTIVHLPEAAGGSLSLPEAKSAFTRNRWPFKLESERNDSPSRFKKLAPCQWLICGDQGRKAQQYQTETLDPEVDRGRRGYGEEIMQRMRGIMSVIARI